MLTLDASKYRINVPLICHHLKDKTDKERVDMVGALAIITGVPIVIVAVYLIEMYGDMPGLVDKLHRLMKFYHVDKIENTEISICA